MKSIQFYADTNRSDNLLHIETDGCVVNIRVGLTDFDGRRVTSVSISPEDESRGGDGQGSIWTVAEDSNAFVTRVIRHEPGDPPTVTEAPRVARTVYRLTAADLDAHAGRELTDEELEVLARALGNSSIPDAVSEVVFAVTGTLTEEES